jgi:hypothetical protein
VGIRRLKPSLEPDAGGSAAVETDAGATKSELDCGAVAMVGSTFPCAGLSTLADEDPSASNCRDTIPPASNPWAGAALVATVSVSVCGCTVELRGELDVEGETVVVPDSLVEELPDPVELLVTRRPTTGAARKDKFVI